MGSGWSVAEQYEGDIKSEGTINLRKISVSIKATLKYQNKINAQCTLFMCIAHPLSLVKSGERNCQTSQPLLFDPVVYVGLPLSVVTEYVHHHLIKQTHIEVVSDLLKVCRSEVIVGRPEQSKNIRKLLLQLYKHLILISHEKGIVSSSFQNGCGPEAVVVLLDAPLNPTSTYGNTSLQ